MTEGFSADWLALREPFDHAARSVKLAHRLAALLPQRRPQVLDLGAGTGSLFRFMAPIIGRGQDWMLLDADGALLDEAFGRTAAWGRRQGFAATAEGDTLSLSTPHGLWRMRAVQRQLSELFGAPVLAPADAEQSPAKPSSPRKREPRRTTTVRRPLGPRLRGDDAASAITLPADAIVCSALLDLVSAAWLNRLRDTLKIPLLACLTVDGRDTWRPHHPLDVLVHTAFQRDMLRDKGLGRALGTTAWRALNARGGIAASAPSGWRIPRTALHMQRALIDGTAAAARRASPAHAAAITAWQEARLRQALRGGLAITIGHRDILLLPPGG